MAVTYGFYNSLNKDRVYNAEQMSSIFNGIITDGVFASIGGSLMPIAGTGMQVVVKTGKCWFNSTWTLNDALLPLDIEAADVSLTRIDAVVVEINSAISSRTNAIKVLKGTPSANPAKPTLANTETLHQYALGYITVNSGVTSITADKIEVNVGKSACPFITSVLQQTDITALFNQWDAEFSTWFANVQAQLSGNVAANLQRQIDQNYENTLRSSTKTILGLPQNAIPDDAFLSLIVGTGFYGYKVKVLLSNGEHADAGIKVNGITALNGEQLYTDENGEAFGKSTNQSVSISIENPYIDQKTPSAKTVQSAGTITDVEIQFAAITEMIIVTESKNVQCSAAMSDVDITLVGGGGGGGGYGNEGKHVNGSGGGGGYVQTYLSRILANNNMQIIIGAGGSGGEFKSDGGDGGATQIIIQNNENMIANGGKAGLAAFKYDSDVLGGVGNGNGGGTYYASGLDKYDQLPGGKGSGYIFDDISLGYAGGGGGGAGYTGGYTSTYHNPGGSPYGGHGAYYDGSSSGSSGRQASSGTGAGAGGGGGVYGLYGAKGGNGRAYFRFHFS